MVAAMLPVMAGQRGRCGNWHRRSCVESDAPSRHPAQHPDQLTDVRDPLLEQVPDPMSYFYASAALGANARYCREPRESAASQRRQDHEDLVAVIARCQPQCAGPAADLAPAEPGIETLEPRAAPYGKVQLLQAHLPAGHLPGVRQQSTTDSLAPEGREGLQTADRAPMCDERVRVTVQVHPAGQDVASDSDQKPAIVAEASDELISHRRDDGGIDGQKRETNGPTSIADGDPAVNQFLSQSCADVLRITALVQDRRHSLTHTRSLPRPQVVSLRDLTLLAPLCVKRQLR
jgi:hypothetical protein